MTGIAAPLGILACLSMAAASGTAVPVWNRAICYGGRDIPKEAPDPPNGCHAVMCCAAHRRLKAFP